LGHVHTLDLSECNQLTDVSALGHVHTLKFKFLWSVYRCQCLGPCAYLEFE
jgi:hypothetical protein